MKDSTISIFTDGSSLINPTERTGAKAVIFRTGVNEPPIKLSKVVFWNSTKYHKEIDAILLALKHIFSTQSKVSAKTIHILSDSIVAILAITSLSPQEIRYDKMEEIIYIINSLICFCNILCQCNILFSALWYKSKWRSRLTKVGVLAVRKMIKEISRKYT